MSLIWWYIVLQALSALAAPLAFVCFFRCRDRGWAYAKGIGVMLPLHITWLLAHAGVPYSFGLLFFSVVAMAGLSALLLRRHFGEMRQWITEEWRRLVVIEALFLGAMLFFGIVRAYNPEIESRFRGYGSEKLMDIMLVNSVHQSSYFPPHDAWFAGETINYYWYGYYVCSALSKLSLLPTHYGYNLALVTAFALAAVMAFALVWHLTGRWWAGGLAAVALTVLGNPQSFRLHVGWGIGALDGARYLWDCSRVINAGRTINEFPYFSFLWGDLHGHVTSFPFTVLVLACALCIWADRKTHWSAWVLGPLVTALAYGTAVACSNWDLPAYALVIVLTSVAFFPREVNARSLGAWLAAAAVQRLLAAILGIVLILPFLLAFEAPKKSLNWEVTQKTPLHEFFFMHGYAAFLVSTLLVWLVVRAIQRDRHYLWPALLVLAGLLVPFGYYQSYHHTVRMDGPVKDKFQAYVVQPIGWALYNRVQPPKVEGGDAERLEREWERRREEQRSRIPSEELRASLPWFAWPNTVAATMQTPEQGDAERDKAFLLPGLLMAALLLLLWELLRLLFPALLERRAGDSRELAPFGELYAYRAVLTLLILATGILLGTEFVAVSDFYGKASERMNTLFKFHIEAWTMLAVAGGWILALVFGGEWRRLKDWLRGQALAATIAHWAAVVLIVVAVWRYVSFVLRFSAGQQRSPAPVWPYVAGIVALLTALAVLVVLEQLRRLQPEQQLARRLKGLWCVPWVGLLLLCLTFTFRATAIKTDRAHDSVKGRPVPTLDGRAWLGQDHPEDLELIRWLLRNGRGLAAARPVPYLLEAVSNETYEYYGRISAFTGFPALVGWPNHEGIWRGHAPVVGEREREGKRIFTTRHLDEACRLTEKYDVDCIIIGDLERKTFGRGLIDEKFLPHTDELFAAGSSTVRSAWNKPCDELAGVALAGLEVRTDKTPPAPQRPLEAVRRLGGQAAGGPGAGPGQLQEPRGVAFGPDGSVYVADSRNGRISVFTADGAFARFVPDPGETNPRARPGTEYSGVGDVAVDALGNVFLADTWGKSVEGGWGRVVAYDAAGRFRWEASKGLFGPRGIAVADNGEIFVTNTGGKNVHVYGPDGRFRREWGREGEGKGEFLEPVGIAVHGDRVYVCDTGNHRVQVFAHNGTPVFEFAPYGWNEPPVGIEPHVDVGTDGRIYVTDSTKGQLQVFSAQGDPIQHVLSGLARPIGVAVSGAVGAVAERDAHQVSLFTLP